MAVVNARLRREDAAFGINTCVESSVWLQAELLIVHELHSLLLFLESASAFLSFRYRFFSRCSILVASSLAVIISVARSKLMALHAHD